MTSESVAVVTRTKERPLMLRRARTSVAGQTFRDLVWVVVNDGGDPAPVESEAAAARVAGLRAIVIHRNSSGGMEAASNLGVRAADTRYAVLHDDDDSWEPGFLTATVGALERDGRFVGAVTHAATVTEEIRGDAIVTLDRRAQNRWLRAVYLADLVVANLFPPISFVFRREAYDAVGGFDESFPVLGDWEFNLKMAMQGDIQVVAKMLANYHIRADDPDKSPAYANSVVARQELHFQQDAMFRNRMLRADMAERRIGLGWMLTLARQQNQPRRPAHGPRRQRSVVNRAVTAVSDLFGRFPGGPPRGKNR